VEQSVSAPRRRAFPHKAALVNPIAKQAFVMRFDREEKISTIGPNSGLQERGSLDLLNADVREGSENLLDVVTQCNVCDAMLVRRPYLRILEGDKRSTGTAIFIIDGVKAAEGPFKQFLVDGPEDPALDSPFEWLKTTGLFLSGDLRPGPSGEVAAMEEPPSIFAPNGSFLQIRTADVRIPDGKSLRIEAGFLAATYTTKDVKAARPPMA